MPKIQSLALILIAFLVLAYSGVMFLETYEDHILKVSFSNFGQSNIIYYKLNFSFWPEIFSHVNNLNRNIPWYEVFLSAINIISLFLCSRKLKGGWFDNTVFVLAILVPQLIFLNYTRTTIFAAAVATIGILQSKHKREAIGYMILLLTAASIRWQLSIYTILIVVPLYLHFTNIKRIWWIAFLAIIPAYIYIQNTSPERISFHKTEPYIFSLNDSKNAKAIMEEDTQLLLIKEMVVRFIIPERTIINENSLTQITYKTFFGADALMNIVKNLIHKVTVFHNKPPVYLLIGYVFLILSLYVFYVLKIHQYGYKHLIKIALAVAIITATVVLVRAVFYVIYPSLFIIILYVLNNNFIKETKQKISVLVMSVCITFVSILYSFELQKKILPDTDTVNDVFNKIEQLQHPKRAVVWDSQSVMVNFKPLFRPVISDYKNYFMEEPYIDILSQVSDNSLGNYNDFVAHMANESVWVVDKERFLFINKYLKTFYGIEYDYSVLKSFPYTKDQKVNKVPNNPHDSDTTILVIQVNRF